MICRNCGKEIDDNATECIYCGCPTGLEEAVAEDESDRINAEEEYYEEKDGRHTYRQIPRAADPVSRVLFPELRFRPPYPFYARS